MPPPVAVMVMGYVPMRAVRETFRLKCDEPEPGAGMGLVPKLYVTPEGTPVADKVTAELNPPETDVVTTA